MKRTITILLIFCMLFSVVGGLPVSAAQWYDCYELTQQNGKITHDGSNLNFYCDVYHENGGDVKAVNKEFKPINGAIDVEWTIKVNSYSGYEFLIVNTGVYRTYFVFSATGIRYRDESGQTVLIEYPLGYEETDFRVIAQNAVGSVYANGRVIADNITFQKEKTSAQITVGTYGGKQGQLSDFTIRNITARPYAGETGTAAGGDPPSLTTPPETVFYDFTEEEDLSEWRLSGQNIWSVDRESGILRGENSGYYAMQSAFLRVSFADDFMVETRLRFVEHGDDTGIKIYWPGGYVDLGMRERYFDWDSDVSDIFEPGELGDDWHVIKLKSINNKERVQVYVDDKPVWSIVPKASSRAYYHIQLTTYGTGTASSITEYDWIRYEPIWNGDIQLPKALDGGEYLQGEEIPLKAEVTSASEVPYVDYQLNGKTIATGKEENGYAVSLTDVPAGKHSITASYGEWKSLESNITVVPPVEVGINIENVSKDKIVAQLDSYDKLGQIAEVAYFLNGLPVATQTDEPYRSELEFSGTEGANLIAVCKDTNGMVLGKATKEILPQFSDKDISEHYSNEISYLVEGDGGSATVELSNGTHQLKVKHTSDSVICFTAEGEVSVPAGIGKFTILTDGPFADLYYGGKHLKSFFLPQTCEKKNDRSEDGLRISKWNLSIPESRGSYFTDRDVKVQKAVYPLTDVEGFYNLDFIASETDQGQLIVNDTAFGLDLTLRDGKIYLQVANNSKSVPFEDEVAVMPKGEVYYRVAMAAGMGTIYADGKFLAAFRCVKAGGEATLGVDVRDGDGFSYLAVHEYNDLYLYQDDFNQSGLTDSMDFWMNSKGSTNYVDDVEGTMIINGIGKTNAITELNAFAGNVSMEADVTLKNCKDGFWFLLNHPVSETYTKAGYNFKTKKFEILDRIDGDSRITKVETDGEWKIGEKVHLAVTAEEKGAGKVVTLYVNGTPVLSKTDSFPHRGKVGFIISDGVASIESFSYRGDTKPLIDVRDTVHVGMTQEMIEREDGSIVLGNLGGRSVTTDGGRTWTALDADGWMSPHVLRLRNGALIAKTGQRVGNTAYGRPAYEQKIAVSYDDGKTWEYLGAMIEGAHDGHGNTIHRLTEGPLLPGKDYGRIFFIGTFTIRSENYGNATVWYSDDMGKTWTEGFTFTYENMGYTNMQEPIVIATETSTRIYYRSDLGTIRYYESPDGGETWDPLDSHETPFFMGLNCFGMDRDLETGEIYLVWSADNTNGGERFQFPRTNWRVAKTADDGETWEYIGTLFENNTDECPQMNLGGYTTSEYFIANSYMADTYNTSDYKGRVGMFPKTKQTTQVRDDQVHIYSRAYLEQMRGVRTDLLERSLLIHPQSGTAMMYGNRVENVVNESGVAVECAAAFLGASVENGENGTVIFRTGNTTVSLKAIEKNDRKFIAPEVIAEEYGLHLQQEQGVMILSSYRDWTGRERETLCNSLSLFSE